MIRSIEHEVTLFIIYIPVQSSSIYNKFAFVIGLLKYIFNNEKGRYVLGFNMSTEKPIISSYHATAKWLIIKT